MKKLTKLLSIMLLASMACGTMLSDVQFGQRLGSLDNVKAAGFIPVRAYLKGLGKEPDLSNIARTGTLPTFPEVVGHAIVYVSGNIDPRYSFPVTAMLKPDLTAYVYPRPGGTSVHDLNDNAVGNPYDKVQFLARTIYDIFYIHPTATFPDIIKPFQS